MKLSFLVVGCLVGLGLVSGACSASNTDEPAANAAGRAGESAQAGQGATSNSAVGCDQSACEPVDNGDTAGTGGAAACDQSACGPSDICKVQMDTLIECRGGAYYWDYHRSSSKCGGTVIVQSTAIGVSSWTFDASGKLVGMESFDDTRKKTCWGQPCEAIGTPIDLCLGVGPKWPGETDTGAGGAGGGTDGTAGAGAGGAP